MNLYLFRRNWQNFLCTLLFMFILIFLVILLTMPNSVWGKAPMPKKDVRRFIFNTEPSGAYVRISFDKGATRKIIGKSGTPLLIDTKEAVSAEEIMVFFEKLNYDTRMEIIKADYFKSHWQYPEQGKIQLTSSYRKTLFLSDPPGAGVYLDLYSNPQNPVFLCKTGEQFQFNTYNLAEGKEYTIYIRLTHFREWKGSIAKLALQPGTLNYFPPNKIPIKLTPEIPVIVPAYYWAKTHMVLTIILISLSLPLIAYLTFYLVLPKMRQSRESKARMDYWEALAGKVNRSDPMFGLRVGNYRILEKLGEGGMAAVYKAVPESTFREEESVAVKIMHTNLMNDPQFSRRFKREIQISKELNHPNILRVLDYEDQEGILYIVMEFIKGQTLKKLIPEKGYSLAEFMEIYSQILRAVEYAHSKGIVHRDLKPDNIMITEKGRVIIMDFGLARGHDHSAITVAGSTFGTPAYMAPEQIRAGEYDARSDQYSLGVVAYQMLTGEVPFWDEITANIIFKQLTDEPPSIREKRPDLPEGIEKTVKRMLQKEQEDRFATLREVEEAFQKAIKNTSEGDQTGVGETLK